MMTDIPVCPGHLALLSQSAHQTAQWEVLTPPPPHAPMDPLLLLNEQVKIGCFWHQAVNFKNGQFPLAIQASVVHWSSGPIQLKQKNC